MRALLFACAFLFLGLAYPQAVNATFPAATTTDILEWTGDKTCCTPYPTIQAALDGNKVWFDQFVPCSSFSGLTWFDSGYRYQCTSPTEFPADIAVGFHPCPAGSAP